MRVDIDKAPEVKKSFMLSELHEEGWYRDQNSDIVLILREYNSGKLFRAAFIRDDTLTGWLPKESYHLEDKYTKVDIKVTI